MVVTTIAVLIILSLPAGGKVQQRPTVTVAGPWNVRVQYGEKETILSVPPPAVVSVTSEDLGPLPLFNPNAGGWAKGVRLHGVMTQETTTPGLLVPESLVLQAGPRADSTVYERGRDYEADLFWGTVGRLAGGRIAADQRVFAMYRHGLLRLDSLVLTAKGEMVLRTGQPSVAAPQPPALGPGERRLANIWLPGRVEKLTADNLFPIMESGYPGPPAEAPSPAERLLPKTMAKLKAGEPVRILAWGDSVTDAGYLPDPARERWQEQFAARLRQRYPKARIDLVTEAWGGRNTASYLAEPPGSPHNYREKVLGAKPDLIISEFVNDAGLSPEQVEERYAKLLADFQGIGAEWIILTPHYVRPDWMNLTRERDIDADPRPYVAGLRAFAPKHGVGLADASLRWGRLWRQGIPYTSLLLNSINHPNALGMKLFADSLLALFPASSPPPAPANASALRVIRSALEQIYAGKLDRGLLTPALAAKMSPGRVKSLQASMRQYGSVRSARLIATKAGEVGQTCTVRVMLGETAFIVTAVATPENRLDDLKFIEE